MHLTYQVWITDELSRQPQERLLKVVVGLSRDIVILEVLLSMKCNGLRLDFTLLHINLISAENDGHLFTDSNEVTCWLN